MRVGLQLVTASFMFLYFQAGAAPGAHRVFNEAVQDLVRAPEYQATENEIRSIELEFQSRDLILQPEFEMGVQRYNENRELLTSSTSSTRKPRIDTLSATLRKPFSTGTLVEVSPSWEKALTPNLDPQHRATVDWQIALTQSLWKDFFGRSTSLRRAREAFERKEQLAAALKRRAQMLVEFENLYWDWALALREMELQNKNLKRSKEILSWVQDRYRRAAAESTDLLQARASHVKRQVQVAALKQSLTQVLTRMQRFVPGHKWQPLPEDLSSARSETSLTAPWRQDQLAEPVTFEFLEVDNQASAEAERAREARESIRPELNLELAYGKNAIDPQSSEAWQGAMNETHEYSSVGVVFKTGLDLSLERKYVDSQRALRDAAFKRRDARKAESRVAWSQLKQELRDLKDRIVTAEELVELQLKKANAERERYRKGRSTAFQALTFEQEAVESEIALWTLYALTRKTEARARLFAR
jgi:outer membrane protein TolC